METDPRARSDGQSQGPLEANIIRERAQRIIIGEPLEKKPDDLALASALLDGRLVVGRHPPTDFSHDPTWSEDPFESPGWKFGFHNLGWVDRLRRAHDLTRHPAYLELYEKLLRSWWATNAHTASTTTSRNVTSDFRWLDMATAWRTRVYLAAVAALGPQPWIVESLQLHADVLADDSGYLGRGNHALHQAMALACVGYVLETPEWINTAVARVETLLPRVIDEEGSSLEGSASYQRSNYDWWSTAREILRIAGAVISDAWSRIDLMPSTMAHLVAPDGEWIMYGDTIPAARLDPIGATHFDYAITGGARGEAPASDSIKLDAGYLLSRSSWSFTMGSPVHLIASRFGHPMSAQAHAHEDLGSIVFYSGQRRLIEDSGMFGYFAGSTRRHLVSNRAHNVILIDDAAYYRSASGPLTASHIRDDAVFANMRTGVLSGAIWNRTIIALPTIPILIVDDRIKQQQSRRILQRWHLGHGAVIQAVDNVVRVTDDSGEAPLRFHYLGDWLPKFRLEEGLRSTRQGSIDSVPVLDAIHSERKRFTVLITLSDLDPVLVGHTSSGFQIRVRRGNEEMLIGVENAGTGAGLILPQSQSTTAERPRR